jgi:hypothetical protein
LYNALATNGLAINLKNVFLQFHLWRFLDTQFWQQDRPQQQVTALILNLAPPPGHQTIATFSRHGKLLPPFLAKLCTGVAPFN